MYITFVPNLTSSRVHILPQSSLPSFSLHQVFPRYKKENADLHNLKKSETTAFGTGMVRFFTHSLKCTVWVIWGSENSAEPGLFNSLISGERAVGVDKHQAGNAECHTREDPKKVSLQWRLWLWKQWHHYKQQRCDWASSPFTWVWDPGLGTLPIISQPTSSSLPAPPLSYSVFRAGVMSPISVSYTQGHADQCHP